MIRILLVLGFIFATGCDQAGDEFDLADAVTLTTDKPGYVAETQLATRRHQFDVVARLHNDSAMTIFLARCKPANTSPIYGIDVVPPSNGGESGYNLVWGCVGGVAPIEVLPNQSRVDTLQVFGPTFFSNTSGGPSAILEGQFRLHYYISGCQSRFDCRFETLIAQSNLFTVELRE